jgi:hypothetical protein
MLLFCLARRRRWRVPAASIAFIALGCLVSTISNVGHGGIRAVAPTSAEDALYLGPTVDHQAFRGYGDLAFVSLGALYVLDGSDGEIRQLAAIGAEATNPQFSPDGKWLAYSVGTCTCFGLARADGSGAHAVTLSPKTGGPSWLPDSHLLVGGTVFQPSSNGKLTATGKVPAGLVAWSPSGDEFAFEATHVNQAKDGAFKGYWDLEVSPTLDGTRTVRYQSAISFNPASGRGFQGDQFAGAQVLPGHAGVLVWVDPGSSADGSGGWPLYLLRGPAQRPQALGRAFDRTVPANAVGTLAVASGDNRFGWVGDQLHICPARAQVCSVVKASPGLIAFDPAWSPGTGELALVEASAKTPGNWEQATTVAWYQTHHLFLLSSGSSRPAEVPGTQGASDPAWSTDGRSLIYVANDAVWLISHLGAAPVEIASPLLVPTDWGARFGVVHWTSDLAWSDAAGGRQEPGDWSGRSNSRAANAFSLHLSWPDDHQCGFKGLIPAAVIKSSGFPRRGRLGGGK